MSARILPALVVMVALAAPVRGGVLPGRQDVEPLAALIEPRSADGIPVGCSLGLGTDDAAELVEVRWRSGLQQELRRVVRDRLVYVDAFPLSLGAR